MEGNVIQSIWNWVYHLLVVMDTIYIPFAQCSLLEVFLGMTLFSCLLSLLIPWFYFEGDENI